jgi:hypothetical protein
MAGGASSIVHNSHDRANNFVKRDFLQVKTDIIADIRETRYFARKNNARNWIPGT